MTDAAGQWHAVEQGETLISLAHRFEFSDWKEIWSHAENKTLRAQRSNPQALRPGDRVFLPPKVARWLKLPGGGKYTLKVPGSEPFFSMHLSDEAGHPYANLKYELKLDGKTISGTTSEKGLVAHNVPPDVKIGVLTLWPDPKNPEDQVTWRVKIGHLDPVESVSGAQARLNNLGYNVGALSGVLDAKTREALKAFQRHIGESSPSGELDAKTIAALKTQQNER